MQVPIKSLAVCALLAASATLFAAGWPEFRGANTDGIVQLQNVPETFAVTPVWKIALGNGYGQIIVEGDKSYAFFQRGEDEVVTCLETKTGHELWAKTIDVSIHDRQGGDGPRTTPALSGDRLYIMGTHRKLVCLDRMTGKEIWAHSIKEEAGGKDESYGHAASPVVVDDVVVVTGGGPGKGILAFNKISGELAWGKTNEMPTHATPTVATILDAKQIICFMKSGLVTLDPKTGETLWTYEFPIKNAVGASPVVGGKNGDIVFCSSGYNVGAAACRITKNGDKWVATELWRTPKKSPMHWSSPVYHDGCVYGLIGQNGTPLSSKGELSCVDIETGAIQWSEKEIGSQGGLILLGDKLLVQRSNGELVLAAASRAGFKEFGRIKVIGGKSWSAPSFADGMIFVRSTSEGDLAAEGACVKLGN